MTYLRKANPSALTSHRAATGHFAAPTPSHRPLLSSFPVGDKSTPGALWPLTDRRGGAGWLTSAARLHRSGLARPTTEQAGPQERNSRRLIPHFAGSKLPLHRISRL